MRNWPKFIQISGQALNISMGIFRGALKLGSVLRLKETDDEVLQV